MKIKWNEKRDHRNEKIEEHIKGPKRTETNIKIATDKVILGTNKIK